MKSINYIGKISALSDRYGNYLLELMDYCHKSGLMYITQDEAKAFYDLLIKRLGITEKEIEDGTR